MSKTTRKRRMADMLNKCERILYLSQLQCIAINEVKDNIESKIQVELEATNDTGNDIA